VTPIHALPPVLSFAGHSFSPLFFCEDCLWTFFFLADGVSGWVVVLYDFLLFLFLLSCTPNVGILPGDPRSFFCCPGPRSTGGPATDYALVLCCTHLSHSSTLFFHIAKGVSRISLLLSSPQSLPLRIIPRFGALVSEKNWFPRTIYS